MSHFIICSKSLFILGTPKGQARTQFEQAMHRGFSEDCTMPTSVCLIASAGRRRRKSAGGNACRRLERPRSYAHGRGTPVNHCMTAVGFAFRARVEPGLAANA